MIINKHPYKKLHSKIYKKLSQLNCINNFNCLKFEKAQQYVIYNDTSQYTKMLVKPTHIVQVNYKELLKLKKKLKSGYLLLSTKFGVITDKNALLNHSGGLILCYIRYNE